jgi:hypothetical protein
MSDTEEITETPEGEDHAASTSGAAGPSAESTAPKAEEKRSKRTPRPNPKSEEQSDEQKEIERTRKNLIGCGRMIISEFPYTDNLHVASNSRPTESTFIAQYFGQYHDEKVIKELILKENPVPESRYLKSLTLDDDMVSLSHESQQQQSETRTKACRKPQPR